MTVTGNTSPILQPRNDTRQYEALVLSNNIRVLLCSDPEADKAAAAMDVHVGYFSDPDDVPGLAHFLEHMLFYASEKYPLEDSYSKFLNEHGGRSNAYTSMEHTNFHFDVSHEYLGDALDRFAQFFISPLLSADATGREMNAVDSENTKNLVSDMWRFDQLQKHLSSGEHPYHKFGTGNLRTLDANVRAKGLDTRDELLKLYHDNYSANLMCLVVYGREPIHQLHTLVERLFSSVKDTGRDVPRFLGDPCRPGEDLGILVRAVPVREDHTLMLQWPVQPDIKQYKEGPCRYLGHLVAHEADGSLFAWLKELGWANSLAAGGGEGTGEFAFFSVSIELTDEGHEHAKEVAGLVFDYIALVQEKGVEEWKFKEVSDVASINFHFKDKIEPITYATRLASNMQSYPVEDYLAGCSLPRRFDAAAIHDVLDRLTLDNVRVLWTSQRFKGATSHKEPWYGTEYSLERIPLDWREACTVSKRSPHLHLPEPNVFIPKDFSLKDDPLKAPHPVLLQQGPLSRLWYKPDHTFKTPKAYLELEFMCPETYQSPESSVLSRIFVKMLSDYLNEYAYYAEIAGLGYSIRNTNTGLQVSVSGYNDKLLVLAEKIVERVIGFEVKEARFDIVKEKVRKDYANFKYSQSYSVAMYDLRLLLDHQHWHINEYLAVVPSLTVADLALFFPRLLSRTFLECFISGNIRADEAEGFMARLEASLTTGAGSALRIRPVFPSQHAELRVVSLAAGSDFYHQSPVLNTEDQNSALEAYFQVGMDEPRINALGQLFVQAAKRDAFYQLRTVEQLGYIVHLLPRLDSGVRGLQFIIQSSVLDAQGLDARVEAFLQTFSNTLGTMSDEDFKTHVDALIALKLEKFKNLEEEFLYFWSEIDAGTLRFDRIEAEVAALQTLQRQDLVDFFAAYVARGAPKRRKLSVQVFGKNHLAMLAVPNVMGCNGAKAPNTKRADTQGQRQEGSRPAARDSVECPGVGGEGVVSEADGAKEEALETAGNEGEVSLVGGALARANGPVKGTHPGTENSGSGWEGAIRIDDMYSFKRSQQLFPSYKGRGDRLAAL